MNAIPAANAPLMKLSDRRGGFIFTIEWRPGFDDPDMDRAKGTPPVLIDVDVKWEFPKPTPVEIFLAAKPPHRGSDHGRNTECEDSGTFISLLLRHGWTAAQLFDKTKQGGLARTVVQFLRDRCPAAYWEGDPA